MCLRLFILPNYMYTVNMIFRLNIRENKVSQISWYISKFIMTMKLNTEYL